jgi:hypothetical protein
MKKFSKYFISVIVILLIAYVYYYVSLPAVNIHNPGFWFFIIGAFVIACIIAGIASYRKDKYIHSVRELFQNKIFAFFASITVIIVLIYIGGSILSSPMVNAKKYQQMLAVTDRNFTEDIKEISFKDIPILDADSAALFGSRKMGSIMEYVSQYEVGTNYTQINYKGVPVRVTPLQYGSAIKWLTNRSKGIPAYMQIDMATQEVQLVKLTQGIKYSDSEHFGHNIYRYLRFHFPTYILNNVHFEIDDNGTPYWI